MAVDKIHVLMVCLGNICRSPTAEAVFRHQVETAKLSAHIQVDSAGTGSWHIGQPPDRRATLAAATRDYDMSALRARQVTAADLDTFDYIFAMDRQNLQDLLALSTAENRHKVSLFLHHGNGDHDEVPDPYYAGAEGFELVLDLVEEASGNLVQTLAGKHQLI